MVRSSVAALLALAACASYAAPAPVPRVKDADLYFPVEVGATWTYTLALHKREDTATVTHVEQTKAGKLVTVGRVEKDKTVTAMKVLVSKNGVYEVEVGGEKFDPPRCVLKLPAKAGDTWKRKRPDSDELEGTATVACAEEVETPAGKYQAIRVDWEITSAGRMQRASFWYAPRVGMVKNSFKTDDGDDEAVLQSFKATK